MVENGPRTHELVGEIQAMRDLFQTRSRELEKRLTSLETKMASIMAIGGLLGSVIVGVVTLLVIHVLL